MQVPDVTVALDAGPGSVQLFAEATMFDEIPSLCEIVCAVCKRRLAALRFEHHKASLVYLGHISLNLLAAATR